MRQVDLVVVGGGPSGSAAAFTARKRGLSVVLIDKAKFPRDKLCGGLLSGRTKAQVERVFGLDFTGDIFMPRQQFIFSWKNKVFAEATSPDVMHLTMRRDFDAWLLAATKSAGAEVYEGARGVEPALDQNRLTLPDGTEIAYRALIGADSVNSGIARSLFGQPFDRAKIGFTLETEVPYDQSRRDVTMPIQIDFGSTAWGYAWSFPKTKSVTLGLGGLEAKTKDFKANMAALAKLHAASPDALHVKGHFIPFGHFPAVPGRGNVLLVGDAAGLVDPLTGEGIAYAIESGALAANLIADALAAGTADMATPYAAALAPIHQSLQASNNLAAAMHTPYVPAVVKRKLVSDPRVMAKFLAILNGRAESRDVANFSIRRWMIGR